jgi:hypothetical protein
VGEVSTFAADLAALPAMSCQRARRADAIADLAFDPCCPATGAPHPIDLVGADIGGAFVYGCSAWNIDLTRAKQSNLRITRTNEGTITVDDLKTAQFIYVLLHNENVRDVIDTVTIKVVLLLGRFTPQRKAVLDTLKAWLREHDCVPVIFDFDGPTRRDFTETVVTINGGVHPNVEFGLRMLFV